MNEEAAVQTTLSSLLDAGEVSSIRVVGDSLTAGYLLDGYNAPSDTGVVIYRSTAGTYFETPTSVPCWTNEFRSYATARGVESFVNAGISGYRMSDLADGPDAWLGEGADVIVVMLGTNDVGQETPASFRRVARLALEEVSDRCRHLVVVSPPTNELSSYSWSDAMVQVDQILDEECAAHGWEHVSLLDALTVGTSDFLPDGVHPTEEGSHKLWAELKDQLNLV